MSRFAVMGGVLLSFVIAALLKALGLPFPASLAGGFAGTAGAALIASRWTDLGEEVMLPVLAAVFLALSGGMLAFSITRGYGALTPLLVIAAVLGIELGAFVVVAILPGRMRGRSDARRVRAGRSELAASHGWRYVATERGLVESLGSMYTHVSRVEAAPELGLAAGGFRTVHLPLAASGPARDVIHGEAAGLPFNVFDFTENRHPRTAWVIELPEHLPYLGIPLAFCWEGWGRSAQDATAGAGAGGFEMALELMFMRSSEVESQGPDHYTESPEFARELLTPEVRALTLARCPSWWIDGRHLISVETGSAPEGEVIGRLGDLSALAELLPRSVMTRWAQEARPAGSGSRAWRLSHSR